MQAYVLRREYDVAWALVPHFCARIREFEEAYNASGGVSGMWRLFQAAFAAGDERMLGVAIFNTGDDGKPTLVGHMVAGTDLHHGDVTCVVYQFEKDVPDDKESIAINNEVQAIVDEWARKLGQTEVSALVISESRARHFKHWGYEYRSSLVTRRIGHGRQGRQNIEHGIDDPVVAGSGVQAVTGECDKEHGGLRGAGAERPAGEGTPGGNVVSGVFGGSFGGSPKD